jgi:hypothetical protein
MVERETADRLDRLEQDIAGIKADIAEIKATLRRLEPLIIRRAGKRRAAQLLATNGEDPIAAAAARRRRVFAAWRCVFAAWLLALGNPRGYRVTELIAEAQRDEELLEALLEVAKGQGSNAKKVDHSRLSRWLAHNENAIADGYKLIVDRNDASRPRWRLVAVDGGAPREYLV